MPRRPRRGRISEKGGPRRINRAFGPAPEESSSASSPGNPPRGAAESRGPQSDSEPARKISFRLEFAPEPRWPRPRRSMGAKQAAVGIDARARGPSRVINRARRGLPVARFLLPVAARPPFGRAGRCCDRASGESLWSPEWVYPSMQKIIFWLGEGLHRWGRRKATVGDS